MLLNTIVNLPTTTCFHWEITGFVLVCLPASWQDIFYLLDIWMLWINGYMLSHCVSFLTLFHCLGTPSLFKGVTRPRCVEMPKPKKEQRSGEL